MNAIEFSSVWEKYRIKFVKENRVSWEEVWALENLSFKVGKGEVLGVIGENGAGKTTLLKLIAGMLMPDMGNLDVQGKVSTLMELGAGFNPEFTGRENILINARIYGLDEESLQHKIGRIIEFAGLEKFIDAPIKYYSQGMYMRLAFALAIYVEPDVLLIDDILAVGDEEAQQKCINKVSELRQAGKTIVIVSHDMNMITKLCDRAILLDRGRIVMEGPPQRTVQHYLESVGDKKGIAALESDKFRAVFNNGKINISYQDNLLTKGAGGYVSFFNHSCGAWFSSSNFSWQIKNAAIDKIVAEGLTRDGTLAQVWTLQLEDSELKWQVEIRQEGVMGVHLDLFLEPQYKEWLTLNKNGIFPPLLNKLNWQDLGINDFPEGLLAITTGTALEALKLPAVILETKDKDSQIKLLNTGYGQEARVIQVYPSNNNFITLTVKIFSEKNKIEDYIGRAEERFLLKEQEAQRQLLLKEQRAKRQIILRQLEALVRLRASRIISLGPLRLYADLDNKVIKIYYKNKEITKRNGLQACFCISKNWLDLNNARWKVEKISGQELSLTLSYPSFMLSQVWKLAFKDGNILETEIKLKITKPALLTNHDVVLELKDGYQNWSTAYEQGNFSVNHYVSNMAPIRLKDSKVSKILLRPGAAKNCPLLLFEATVEANKWIMGIYKHQDEKEKSACLNFSLVIPKKETLVKPGSHDYFKGNIILDKDIKLKEATSKDALELVQGDLKLIIEQGRVKIFYKHRELTTGLGLYTSVRSAGIWYDSHQAIWQIKQKEGNKIIMLGDWPYIPVSQIWQIRLINKNSIFFKVETEIYEELKLEIEQANLMLFPGYKTWEASGVNKGKFLDEYTQDYDISPFRFWYGKSKKIKAGGDKLPSILFKFNLRDKFSRAVIENSDYLYKARLLQYQESGTARTVSKKYTYFEGEIKIGSKS